MTVKRKSLSPHLLEHMAGVLRLLAHPARLRIVEFLEAEGEAPVYEITREVDLLQASASQHLNKMKRAGILTSRRVGKEVWYAIGDRHALTILDCMRKNA